MMRAICTIAVPAAIALASGPASGTSSQTACQVGTVHALKLHMNKIERGRAATEWGDRMALAHTGYSHNDVASYRGNAATFQLRANANRRASNLRALEKSKNDELLRNFRKSCGRCTFETTLGEDALQEIERQETALRQKEQREREQRERERHSEHEQRERERLQKEEDAEYIQVLAAQTLQTRLCKKRSNECKKRSNLVQETLKRWRAVRLEKRAGLSTAELDKWNADWPQFKQRYPDEAQKVQQAIGSLMYRSRMAAMLNR